MVRWRGFGLTSSAFVSSAGAAVASVFPLPFLLLWFLLPFKYFLSGYARRGLVYRVEKQCFPVWSSDYNCKWTRYNLKHVKFDEIYSYWLSLSIRKEFGSIYDHFFLIFRNSTWTLVEKVLHTTNRIEKFWRGFTQKTNCSIGQTSSLICVTRKFLDVLLPCLICGRICLTLIVSSQIFTLILILLRYKYLETFPSSDIIHLTKYLIKESAMYRDSAKARVAARDLRRQQVKLFKLGATITLCAFLISQLADMIF